MIKQHKENGLNIYTWELGASTFKAIPEKGARLMSWDITFAGENRSIIYWPYGEENWSKIANIRGGNPILFPFVARTYDKGEFEFWKTPDGERRPMKMHGYARQGDFIIENIHQSGFTALFNPDENCKNAYPYLYNFRVDYAFKELEMEVTLELENLDSQLIPWCAGHHFYFKLPWHSGHTRNDYEINIPAKKMFVQTPEGKLSPVKHLNKKTNFSDSSLIDRIHTQLTERNIYFGPRSGEENICIQFADHPLPTTWNTVVAWTENEASPFFCVEPWMGPPNSSDHKKGLHFVEAGKKESFKVVISLG